MEINPFTLGIMIPVWKRAKITLPVLRYYRTLFADNPHVDLRVVVAVSPEDPCYRDFLSLKETPSFRFRNTVNFPVSDKWNAAMKVLSQIGVDAACSVNSDMYVTRSYLRQAIKHVRRGTSYVEPTGCYFVDAASGEAFFTRYRNMGASAVMSHDVLEACGYEPYPVGVNRGIDANFRRRLQTKTGFKSKVRIQEHFMRGDIAHVDVKSYANVDGKLEPENINSFSRMLHSAGTEAKRVDGKAVFDYFFDGLMPSFLKG